MTLIETIQQVMCVCLIATLLYAVWSMTVIVRWIRRRQ